MTLARREVPFLNRKRALLVFALVLALRISIAAQFPGNFDSQSFLLAAQIAANGDNIYAGTDRYNYSPLWAYVLAAIWTISDPNTHVFVLLVGLLQIGVDAVSAVFVWRIAECRLGFSSAASHRAAILFFSNPISVLVSSSHGQFDGTAILFLLAAIYWATSAAFPARSARVILFLGLSLLVKHVTAFHPLLFWRRIRRPGLSDAEVAAPYAIFFLSFLPFIAAFQPIIRNVFLYSAGVEPARARPGGLQTYITLSRHPSIFFAVLFLCAVAGFVWMTRRMELPRASLVLFLALLVFLPSYGLQYIVWPVALGSLYPSASYGLFTAVGALRHFSETWSLQLPVRISPYASWLTAIVWLTSEVRRQRSQHHQNF